MQIDTSNQQFVFFLYKKESIDLLFLINLEY